MNTKLLLLIIPIAAISSCSSVYKTGQTPDDVYYSPVRTGYIEKENEQRRQDDARRTATLEDRQIRMGINNPRWRWLDNDFMYSYNYNPYLYGYNYGYYYNPFYCTLPVYYPVIITPATPRNTTPRMVNLASYNTGYNNVNTAIKPKTGVTYSSRPANNNYNNSNSGLGNVLSKILTPGSNNNSNSSSGSSNRTYSPSSSGSSSSSGGGTISRPARKN